MFSMLAPATLHFTGRGVADPGAEKPAAGFVVEPDTVALWDFTNTARETFVVN